MTTKKERILQRALWLACKHMHKMFCVNGFKPYLPMAIKRRLIKQAKEELK